MNPKEEDGTALGRDALPLLRERMATGDSFSLFTVERIMAGNRHDPSLEGMALSENERRQSEQSKSLLTVMKWLGNR
jgi:hypothetical protein